MFFVARVLHTVEIPQRKKAIEITLLAWAIAPADSMVPMRLIPLSKVLRKNQTEIKAQTNKAPSNNNNKNKGSTTLKYLEGF